MKKLKTQKGITLIALIITIIVMLILVGVSVTVALNGGLFETAKKAAEGTQAARDEELLMDADGYIEAVQRRIAVGTEVKIAIGENTFENFYVIKDEGAKLVLLAKYNINTTSLKQENVYGIGANAVAFASGDTSYWSTYTGTYPLNLNEYETCPEGSAISIAREYATETIGNGATGRLMTYEEAEPLSQSNDDIKKILYGTYTDGASLSYWLGSAGDGSGVWFVWGGVWDWNYGDFSNDYGFGVRPVIVISESSVEIVP